MWIGDLVIAKCPGVTRECDSSRKWRLSAAAAPSILHVLYFEPSLGNGHRPVFLSNIVECLLRSNFPIKLTIATSEAPPIDRAPWWKEVASGDCKQVQFFRLPPSRAARCVTGPYVSRGYYQALVAGETARELACSFVFFAWLDHALVGTALGIVDYPCGGILFRSADGAVGGALSRQSPIRWLHYKVRDMLFIHSLKQRQLCFAMSVDALFVTRMKKISAVADRVSFLKDAYQRIDGAIDERVSAERLLRVANVGKPWSARRTYLCVGGIDDRKSVVQCIEACMLVPPEDRCRIRFVIAGKVADSYRTPVTGAIARARAHAPELEVALLDRVLSNSEFHAIFHAADVVLITYRPGFLGSSGNLVQAIAAGKPVIAPDTGMLGQQVREYKLGATVNPRLTQSIADAIHQDLLSPLTLSADSTSEFLRDRSPDQFGCVILSELLRHCG